jgi:hypothetical protein
VPRLPARSPQPEVCPWRGWGGVACCCLALWSSEQVDRHPLPSAVLGVTLGFKLLLSVEREPLMCMGVPGLLVIRGQWPTVGSQETPVSPSASVVCLSLSLLCPVHLALSPPSPPQRGAAAWGWGFVHSWGSICAEDHIFPRPGPIPVPWGAVYTRGNVCCEEWQGCMRMPAGVLGCL